MPFSESLKLQVKRRAHFVCCLCHAVGVEAHHIIQQSEGGKDDFDNAAPLCPNCHETYGQNPEKRKFIKEARDLWYEICDKRFSSDPDRLDEIGRMLCKIATKEDLDNYVCKLGELLSEIISKPNESIGNKLMEISSLSGLLTFRDITKAYKLARERIIAIEIKTDISALNFSYAANIDDAFYHLMRCLDNFSNDPESLKSSIREMNNAIEHINRLPKDACLHVVGIKLTKIEELMNRSMNSKINKKIKALFENAISSYASAQELIHNDSEKAYEYFLKTADICNEIESQLILMKKSTRFQLIKMVIFIISVIIILLVVVKYLHILQ